MLCKKEGLESAYVFSLARRAGKKLVKNERKGIKGEYYQNHLQKINFKPFSFKI